MIVKEKMKPVKGYFVIETYDKDDNLIDIYQDNNKIMARTPFNFACMTYGAGCNGLGGEWPANMSINDLSVGVMALGTDGLDADGFPKVIECNRDMLYSEQRMWVAADANEITSQLEDMNKFVYQTSFNTQPKTTSNVEEMTPVVKTTEGPSFPWDIDNNIPAHYRMTPDGTNGLTFSDTSMDIKTNHTNLVLKYEFTLGQFAGNGVWRLAPAFSEAALYMNYIPKDKGSGANGRPLGAMFSMKTFPKHFKTEACYLRIKWTLIFGTDDCPAEIPPRIDLIGETPITIIKGTVFEDPGAVAYDAEDGIITDDIIRTGTVDINSYGTYILTYTITDSDGLSAEVQRAVKVVAAPVVGYTFEADVQVHYNIP